MIAEVLAPGGALAPELESYEDRPEQRRVAEAIAEAIADGHHLMVEAGTGTGKSLAYLLPALLSGQRVVVSTGTRALQDQLIGKDLPLLRRVLPHPFEAVVLKGTSNYLCRRKLGLAREAASAEILRISEWAETSASGDRAECEDAAEDAPAWQQVTVAPEARLGPRCRFYEECFVTRARRRADKADLVVVNHHLFFADLALRRSDAGARVLPDYDVVIFDEAHQLEDVMTDHFGIEVSSARVEHLLRDFRHWEARAQGTAAALNRSSLLSRLIEHAGNTSGSFFAQLRVRIAPLAMASEGERFTLPEDLIDDDLQDAWFALDTAFDELARGAVLAAEGTADEQRRAGEELAGLAQRCHRVRDHLAVIADRDAGKGEHVFWAHARGPSVSLHASPVSVEGVLGTELLPAVGSAIWTSATLRAGGSFGYFRQRLGLGPDLAEELAVDSPFDYRSQCLLYLPRDVPEPGGEIEARAARLQELLELTEGATFVLFTSHRALREMHARIGRTFAGTVLRQGEAPKAALLQKFRESERSVLLATAAFWEGVDVPGEALSQVVIDKLPFEVPDDPLTAARMRAVEESGREAFASYQVPRAAIALRQGFGRLIRRRSDRGIVTILDPRVVTRRYGRYFLDSLPEVPRTSALQRVRNWWRDVD
jgi:ATP-dependent DNA helicase DinG